jgi:uncharacterized protein
MKKILLIAVITVTSLFSASFDCKKAQTEVEKLICSNETLSQLDDELNVAYKNALDETNNIDVFRQKQRKWLINRNQCKNTNCIKYQYEQQLAYLRYNGFILIYSKNDNICNQFANLLNSDIKQYNEINLSKHEEFNWVEWKQIQKNEWYIDDKKYKRHDYNIFVDYFDINNDNNEEGVFLWESEPRFMLVDIVYTTLKDGKNIEKLILSKERRIWSFYNNQIGEVTGSEGYMSETFSFYEPPLSIKSAKVIYGSVLFPEPYPMKFDNQYFIAVFGVKNKKQYRKYRAPLYSMHNCGNKVTLIKFNPNNSKEGICILEKVQSNIQQYLSCAKK